MSCQTPLEGCRDWRWQGEAGAQRPGKWSFRKTEWLSQGHPAGDGLSHNSVTGALIQSRQVSWRAGEVSQECPPPLAPRLQPRVCFAWLPHATACTSLHITYNKTTTGSAYS